MHAMFENEKEALIEDYERRLKELEQTKDKLFEEMNAKLQKEIAELIR